MQRRPLGSVNNVRKLRLLSYALSFISFFYLLSFLVLPNLSSEGVQATAGVESVPTLSVSPSSTVAFNVDPGTFNSASSTVSVSTNNYTGYTLTLSADTTDLVHNVNSNLTIPTLTLPEGEDYVASSAITNAYGYSLNTTDYYPITTTASGGSELATTSTANSTANEYTLTFGAHVAPTTPAGTYTNTVIVTASANATLANITFDKNTTDTVTNLPVASDNTVSGLTVYLSSKIPTRTNYTFKSWNTEPNGTGTSYAPSDTITLDPEIDNSMVLYAQWKASVFDIIYDANGGDGVMDSTTYKYTNKQEGSSIDLLYASNYSRTGYGFVGFSPVQIDPTDTTTYPTSADVVDAVNDLAADGLIFGPNAYVTLPTGFADHADSNRTIKLYAVWLPSEGSLQGWTGCSTMNIGDITALTDTRDSNVYTVAKLADNKCWATENLRLDVGNATITSTNTNHPTNSFKTAATSASALDSGWCASGSSACDDQIVYHLHNINRSLTASYNNNATSTTYNSWYSYGGMYNWYTATAGNGTYSISSYSTVLSGDLCPSGWKLPTGYGAAGKDFYDLNVALGNNTSTAGSRALRAFPNNFVYSGYFVNTYASVRGGFGEYWSASAGSSNYAYYMSFSSTGVNPGTSNNFKYHGNAVRCLAGSSEQFTLTYDANGGEGAPAAQTSSGNGIAEFVLSSTVPTRSGYTFSGWMDENGSEAGAGETFTASDANTTLYAIWTNNSCNASATTIGTGNSTDAVCLQDMNSTVKTSMTSKATYNLIDARDGKSYNVSLLDDSEVWMTQNLNYGGTSDTLLTPYDTDLPSGTTFKAPASTTSFEATSDSTTYVSPKILTDSTYGGYYSYAAAIASTSKYTASNQNITTSICPSGWDLPTSTQYDNLRTRASLTNYTTAHATPYNFSYAGYRDGDSFTSQTGTIRLWTSTNYSESYAYNTTSYQTPTYSSNYKHYGESVRCIASNGTGTIHYDANGGTGTMNDQTNVEINSTKISANGFTAPDHAQFKEWNTQADGNGTSVAPGASAASAGLTNGGTLNLYAIWDDIYILTFVNTATDTTQTKTVIVGQSTTVTPTSSFSRTGYKLVGWDTVTNDGGDTSGTVVYTNGQTITPTEDMTVYTVWRPVYDVIYNANGGRCEESGDTITDTCMNYVKHTDTWEGDVFDLFASNYSRAGYGFAGWSLNSTAQPDDGVSTIYGPNEAFTAPAYDNNNTITLYAVWVPADTTYTLQTFDASAYESANPTKTVTALRDERDNDVYAIAKLADGNWWMIENLRLDTAGTVGNNINNSSVTNESLSQGYGGIFTGLADPETANFSTSTAANTLYSSTNITGDNLAYRMPRYNNSNAYSRTANPGAYDRRADSSGVSHYTDLNYNIYSYGNYYSWPAAKANTDPTAASANTSICPRGWHLPTGYSASGEFGSLYVAMGGTGDYQTTITFSRKWRAYPNNFIYSGFISYSNFYDRGHIGTYLTASNNSYAVAYILKFHESYVRPGDTTDKFTGRAVRCLADSTSAPGNNNNNPSSPSNSPEPSQQQSSNPEPTQTSSEPAQTSSEPEVQQVASTPKSASAKSANTSLATAEPEPEEEAEEENTEEIDSESGSTTPLGVRQNYGSDDYVSDGTYSSNNTSESSAFATLAAAGLVTTGITLVIVGGKKKKDEEEE